jgi:hypothetical protein
LVNQITACLKSYYPVALRLFGQVHQPTTVAFLQAFPTLQTAQDASVAQIAAVLQGAGHPHARSKAQTIWEQLHAAQLQASPEITRAKSRLLHTLVEQLAVLLPAIAAYDLEITRLFLLHSDSTVFASLPRAGQRLAPRLLAEWGDDRGRYSDAASVQALAGTAPVPFTSGKFSMVRRRHACSKPLRNVLQYYAWQSIQEEPWALAYYQRKRHEGKSHPMAIRALANHWVRIIFALWRKHAAYDASIFLAAQQAHGARAA